MVFTWQCPPLALHWVGATVRSGRGPALRCHLHSCLWNWWLLLLHGKASGPGLLRQPQEPGARAISALVRSAHLHSGTWLWLGCGSAGQDLRLLEGSAHQSPRMGLPPWWRPEWYSGGVPRSPSVIVGVLCRVWGGCGGGSLGLW